MTARRKQKKIKKECIAFIKKAHAPLGSTNIGQFSLDRGLGVHPVMITIHPSLVKPFNLDYHTAAMRDEYMYIDHDIKSITFGNYTPSGWIFYHSDFNYAIKRRSRGVYVLYKRREQSCRFFDFHITCGCANLQHAKQ